jgi:hypothetical protein
MFLKDFLEFKVPIIPMELRKILSIRNLLLEDLQEDKDLKLPLNLRYLVYVQILQDPLEYQLHFVDFTVLSHQGVKESQPKEELVSLVDKYFFINLGSKYSRFRYEFRFHYKKYG